MPKVKRSLSGKIATITGGARGIGQATALALAKQGVTVVIGDLDAEAAVETARLAGGASVGHGLDVTDLDAFTQFFDRVEREVGPIDIHINNAGIMPAGEFAAERPSTTSRMVDINLRAVLHGTQQAITRMRPRGHGHIVNTASGAAFLPGPGFATYCATKAAVATHAEALRLELDGTGIDLSFVAPGLVKTELSLGLPEFRGMRAVTPEEVAAAIVDALQTNRFAVFVPPTVGVGARVYQALPYNVRRALLRVAKLDKLGSQVDMSARSAYEARVHAPALSKPDVTAPIGRDGA